MVDRAALLSERCLTSATPRPRIASPSAAAVPSRESYRVEHQFASGWIALRFLDDSSIALDHFANAGQGMPTRPPIYGQLA
jgi:soluble lytic murein transglycosylase